MCCSCSVLVCGMRKPECEKQETNKGAWTKEEDQKLINHIQVHGEGCWRTVPKASGLRRCGKSCRLRWMNYLRPNLKRGNFGQDEDDLIIKLHALLGNRWSLIAGRLPGRTDNEIKNYWNATLKKKLMAHGIDPKNHRLSQTLPYPRNHDIPNFSTTSSESINDGFSMLRTQVGNHNQLSNITNWLEEDTCGSVNLSLNLTEEMESDERRTLLLFR